MSRAEYYQGIEFIKRNSGTEEEKQHRLKEWKKLALPLVINREAFGEPCGRAGERVYL